MLILGLIVGNMLLPNWLHIS